MSVLWDTSIVIDVLRGFAPAISYARGVDAPPTCSEVTRVEVLRGVRSAERERTERLLQTLRWVVVDEAIARRAGELGRAMRRSDRGVATSDLIIAATADLLGLELATLNVKHFPMFRGLAPPYEA